MIDTWQYAKRKAACTNRRVARSLAAIVMAALGTAATPAHAQTPSRILGPNESLYADQSRVSPNGRFRMYFQNDGILKLQRDESYDLWSTDTFGEITRLDMQDDGNLLVVDEYQGAIWFSGTQGHPGAYLAVLDDGEAVIFSENHEVLWSTGTGTSVENNPPAGGVTYPALPIQWNTLPQGHHPDLRECEGNCGAGCSDRNNPNCSGRPQSWAFETVTEPQYLGTSGPGLMCMGDRLVEWDYESYAAVGRWTYHGSASVACQVHDFMCGAGSLWIGCIAWLGCSDSWDQDWSYDEYVHGYVTLSYIDYGPDSLCTWASGGV